MSTDTAATVPDPTNDASLDGARAWFAQHGLTRPRDGRVIAGVTAAFARRYRVNRLVARVIAVGVAVILTPAIYVALWVLIPSEA